jgi:hypothetical protein
LPSYPHKAPVTVHDSQGVLIGERGTQHNTYVRAETYIHRQVVHSAADSTSELTGSGNTGQPVPVIPRIEADARMEAAAEAMLIAEHRGVKAYAVIASDSAMPPDTRLEAAARAARAAQNYGARAYEAIAKDSSAPISTRMNAAALLKQIAEHLGARAYDAIASDCRTQ